MNLRKDTKLKEQNERPGKERKKGHKTKAKGTKKESETFLCMISDEIYSLLVCYAVRSGKSLPTFRNKLSVTASGATTRFITTQKSAGLKGKVLKS
jgi:hypothetical protein